MPPRSVILVAALLCACGGSAIEQGTMLFNAGRYPEAKKALEKVDSSEYRNLDARSRTTYALYRGLVYGALGDRTNAIAWLGLAKQTEDKFPSSLSEDDKVRLKLADEQYGPLGPTSAPPPSD
jgi:tetratricopeptide (TPR) repeat protein